MPEVAAIIDACFLINFYASAFFESILRDLLFQFYIVEQVKNKSFYIRKPDDSDRGFDYEPIMLDRYLNSNLLKVVKLETEGEKRYF